MISMWNEEDNKLNSHIKPIRKNFKAAVSESKLLSHMNSESNTYRQ